MGRRAHRHRRVDRHGRASTRSTRACRFDGVEIGWRLARWAWGNGYATEAARAVVAYGFETLGLHEILAIAALGNERSHAVMRRLGMTHDPADDFDDPTVPPGPLRRSVLYRLRNPRDGRPHA